MNGPTDEVLMAYADGELSESDRRQLKAQLESQPELAERLRVFEDTRRPLLELFAQKAAEPVPEHIVSLVQTSPTFDGARGSPAHGGFSQRMRTLVAKLREPFALPQFALAGTVAALVVGGSVVYFAGFAGPDLHKAGSPLAVALDTVPSSSSSLLGGDGAIFKSKLTFQSRAGEYCREFLAGQPKGTGQNGVACREKNGDWRMEASAPTKIRADGSEVKTAFEKSTRADVDAALDRLMDQPAFDAEDESALIKNGWREQ